MSIEIEKVSVNLMAVLGLIVKYKPVIDEVYQNTVEWIGKDEKDITEDDLLELVERVQDVLDEALEPLPEDDA